jgi:magnesium transporter
MTETLPPSPAGQPTIRVSHLHDGELTRGGLELISNWQEGTPASIWIDIANPTQHDIEPLLEEWFQFHELAAEDAISINTLPKYDRFDRYDFFVFRALNLQSFGKGVETLKLAAFLGPNFLITIHPGTLASVDVVWNRLPQDRRIMERGSDFLLHSVLDYLVDLHFPLVDRMEERLDEIQTLIFSDPSPTLLDELLNIKRDLNVLRRYSLPQRELFNQISRGDCQFVGRDHLIYFRDLYDHMYRIGESIDIERDLTTSTMDAYLSVVANRTNEIMKVLTVFSAVLLPMNFVAGIYGMNFVNMPELEWRFGYLWAFTLMLSIALFMLSWFYRKGWLWPRRGSLLHRERKIRRKLRGKG